MNGTLPPTEAALRDAFHLGRPGADPGPAGRRLRTWRALAAGSVGQWRSATAVAADALDVRALEGLPQAIDATKACAEGRSSLGLSRHARNGHLVAMVYHYRANTYDTSALYLRSRLWQRPRDISLDLSQLLQDKNWGPHIDPNQIGVAGHSQGGFTSLWLGGAAVNPDLFLGFQRGWKNNKMVPAYLRDQMLPDAEPARDLRDERVKAAFAMAPGDLPGFGMDEAGLRQMKIPTYLIVGTSDTSTPPRTRGVRGEIYPARPARHPAGSSRS